MDRSQSNPTHQMIIGEMEISEQPQDCQTYQTPAASSIESIFPTANANQLLELIAEGHNPDDLHELINQSHRAA